jgi:rSAM/selenodomain-associated transferase 2
MGGAPPAPPDPSLTLGMTSPAPVTVLIPTVNEEDWIAGAIDSAFAAGAAEVIVADGASSDGTPRIVKAHGARLLLADRPRARQLNAAVLAAANENLIVLHADTRLPAGAAEAVAAALDEVDFGGFRIAFIERSLRLRVAAALINLRTSMTRAPWGDQAQFIRRETLLRGGGFREMPFMEDYELAARMTRAGRTRILPLTVQTSGRRFLRLGLLRTAAINWRIIAKYRRGADPGELVRLYRRS